MAGTIGRMTTALASVHNENSAALANLNFDFTLVRFDAPAEFKALGATISNKRRVDAEEGALHKTARRLGALFGDLLPATDELFRAYGNRVSEISSMPNINPTEGSGPDGMFANHIGADTASIWAAVTSGSAAISVHLLGCMLARIFTGPEAVSVWVELVQRQKEHIRTKHGTNLYSGEHNAAFSAAQQDITRRDLSNWDASARAWLQSADQAKSFHHKQTMLILNNASVPVNNEPETYTSVLKAWIAALEAMNNLVRGLPQRVQDGAILLAISSWHLYPDMIVYGGPGVEVKQRDPLFDPAALLTLGLQHVRDDTKSVYWSLPLAFLQYYGHPVQASRTVGQENSRVTYRQFGFIILGCVLNGWGSLVTSIDDGIKWIERLSLAFGISMKDKFDHANQPTWLIYLIVAAQDFTECDESEKAIARQLINLGQRWSTFIHLPANNPPPLFGLSQIGILLNVLKDNHTQVHCLRQLCNHLRLNGSQLIIKYRRSALATDVEYATILPVQLGPSSKKNVRWINLTVEQLGLCNKYSAHLRVITSAKKRRNELLHLIQMESNEAFEAMKRPDGPSAYSVLAKSNDLGTVNQAMMPTVSSWQQNHLNLQSVEWRKELAEIEYIISIWDHRVKVEGLGEILLPVVEYMDPRSQGVSHFRTPAKFLVFPGCLDFEDGIAILLRELRSPATIQSIPAPTFFLGVEDNAALYSINNIYAEQVMNPILDTSFLDSVIRQDKVSFKKLQSYLPECNELVADEISCLRACSMMAEIYQLLPGATISTLVVRQPLYQAKWIPRGMAASFSLSRAQTFACIAMFESGTCNLDPNALLESFAMSSGNSLYVAGALLCDPFENPHTTEIRRVVGNIGRPGITFLISPPEVKFRQADPEKWMAINHHAFDGTLEDHFQKTSIHLSFTEYEVPLVTEEKSRHLIDRGVVLVETLISVYDGGTWVAEVDMVKFMDQSALLRVDHASDAHDVERKFTYQEACQSSPQLTATSVENWDELIEAPRRGVIAIRAHKNWLARLAVTALCTDLEFTPIILPEDPCWTCCAKLIRRVNNVRMALIC